MNSCNISYKYYTLDIEICIYIRFTGNAFFNLLMDLDDFLCSKQEFMCLATGAQNLVGGLIKYMKLICFFFSFVVRSSLR